VGESGGGKMKRLYFIAVILTCLVFISPLFAETGRAGKAAAFLRFGLGARPLGMGSAFTAIGEGFEGCYYNPAGLGMYPVRQAGFTSHNLTLDRKLYTAALVFPVREEAVMGVSWIYGSVGDVIMRDSDRNALGKFSNSSNQVSLTFSRMANDFISVGANLHYLQESLDELTAYTVGADFGAIARYKKLAAFGLSVQNAGSDLNWDSSDYWSQGGDSHTDKIPIRIRTGIGVTLLDQTLIGAMDLVKDLDMNMRFNTGAEYWLTTKVKTLVDNEEEEGEDMVEVTRTKRLLGIRTGYNDGSFTFGGSLIYPFGNMNGAIDYAYLTGRQDEGASHVFTFRIIF
jgi:hypothetical protein